MGRRAVRADRADRWFGSGLPVRLELQLIVDALNGKQIYEEVIDEKEYGVYEDTLKRTPPILRNLVGLWERWGRNIVALSLQDPPTWAHINNFWKAHPPELFGTPSGRVVLLPNIDPGRTPSEKAIRLFSLLLLNADCDKLAGPCARCGNYYIKKRASQKVYCSRRCGNATTATARSREQRNEAHTDKLRRAATAARKWATVRTKLDWKRWILQKEPDITSKFLTRAVNKGEFEAPVRR